MSKRTAVIGGGAAGMMAAIMASENGGSIDLYEKNEKLGKKLFITGKGRCNITNDCDTEELLKNVVTNPKFLYSAFYGFDSRMTQDFFRGLGLRMKVERGNRVFPVSDHSSDVIRVLERCLREKEVKVFLNTPVKEICFGEDGSVEGIIAEGKKYLYDSVVVATGGCSYPSTGSTGDGYQFAESCGMAVTERIPSLVPLVVREEFVKELQGLSLKNVEAVVYDGKREIYRDFGEMLFTHFGVSGPLILSASSYVAKILGKRELKLVIDLKPALTGEQLDRRVLRDFESGRNKQFGNILTKLLPAKLIPVVVSRSGILPEKKVHDITKEERQSLTALLKNFDLTVTALRGFQEAVITKGGVSVKEINPSTMESKKHNGLYFAGEVLDLDALTGGFNLQIAWATGALCGRHIAERNGGFDELQYSD